MSDERPETPKFSHRHNPDGSVDSICRYCFVTVASVVVEAALKAFEQNHVCDPWVLARYKIPVSSGALTDCSVALSADGLFGGLWNDQSLFF